MVLPGVYTKEEQKMLEQWSVSEWEVGWLGDEPVPGKISQWRRLMPPVDQEG
jgi:hypothetical protein